MTSAVVVVGRATAILFNPLAELWKNKQNIVYFLLHIVCSFANYKNINKNKTKLISN